MIVRMKTLRNDLLAFGLVLAFATPLFAGEKGKGKGNGTSPEASAPELKSPGKPHVQPEATKPKEPWLDIKVEISTGERDVIRAYVHTHQTAGRGHKPKNLPPGLAKKVARGGDLSPGWQKKCIRGEILPLEVYEHCHPLPREVLVKLPSPPKGTILVAIDGKVVRLAKATREILDVFEVL